MGGSELTLEKLEVAKRLVAVEITLAETNVHLETIAGILVELKDAKVIQNGRISKLENWKSYLVGGIGAIGGCMAFVYFVIDKLTKG